MIRLTLLCWICFTLSAQSNFLVKEELYRLKKGKVWIVSNDSLNLKLSYDIWKNSYQIFNQFTSKSSTEIDSIFLYLRDEMKLYYIYLEEEDKKREKSDILIIDWINLLIEQFTKRKIVLKKNKSNIER